jgi:hypothetical protein
MLRPSDMSSIYAPKELVEALKSSGLDYSGCNCWEHIATDLRDLAGKDSDFTSSRPVLEEAELLYARYTGCSTENYPAGPAVSYKTPELFISYLIRRGVPLKPYTGTTKVTSAPKDAPPGGVTCTKCNMKNEWAAPNVADCLGMAYLCYNCR